MTKKILIAVILLLLVIQFIRPQRNEGRADTPQDVTHYLQVPADVRQILKTSCYDCHSDSTHYPWYANIQPVGWWLTSHVRDGKRHLNFSDFSQYPKDKLIKKLKGTAGSVREREMPLSSYLIIHRNAQLTDEQIKIIVDWANGEREKLSRQP